MKLVLQRMTLFIGLSLICSTTGFMSATDAPGKTTVSGQEPKPRDPSIKEPVNSSNQTTPQEPVDAPKTTTPQEPANNTRPKITVEYKDAMEFMSDFLNLEIKPTKPIQYWAEQLVLLTRAEPTLKQFRLDLVQAVTHRNSNRVALAFISHQAKFPASMRDYVMHFPGGLKEVKKIIDERMKVDDRTKKN